jgi:hypothetical protein
MDERKEEQWTSRAPHRVFTRSQLCAGWVFRPLCLLVTPSNIRDIRCLCTRAFTQALEASTSSLALR